jgi:hypothetical protein
MGLAKVVYDRLTADLKGVQELAQVLGIPSAEAVEAVSLILDIWRRNRIFFVATDPIFSRYHAKDDPYVQAGLLPLREFRPQGLLLEPQQHKYARSILARRGASAVQALLKKWAADPEHLDTDLAARSFWRTVSVENSLLRKVTLRSSREKPLGSEVWQVNAEVARAVRHAERHRCTTCQRIMPRPAPRESCSRHHCKGTTTSSQPDRENYDVWLMDRPFVMVSAEEHTAQVPGEERERIEQDFKSQKGRTNCLVATPTLEMGVNIGLLDMALMRNVPPRPSNYWQRAGRAGREERMAVVATYCRRSPHDRYFFDDPLRLLGGAIKPPTFNLRNPLLVAKHVRSAILSELLLQCRPRITASTGLSTEPDWLHEQSKTAVYLDGMSRNLHGDPNTARRDQLIRQMLELDGYRVIVIQSRDLDDPEALRQHLRNVALAMDREDLLL